MKLYSFSKKTDNNKPFWHRLEIIDAVHNERVITIVTGWRTNLTMYMMPT
jgi:hypothetical protein